MTRKRNEPKAECPAGDLPINKREAKERRCMMCRRWFSSSWAGERICRRCKATATWRGG
jgi:hypothetical protein